MRHLVDPELLPLVDTLVLPELGGATLPAVRAALAARPPGAAPAPSGVVREIVGPDGGPLRLVLHEGPSADVPQPAILHLHGGGHVLGSAEASAAEAARWAAEAQALVVVVDYRLSPEAPHPAALEDAYAALLWMHAEAAELGIEPERVVVAGDSAGGGLAAALCLLARDRGGPAIAFQLLGQPMLDDRTASDPSGPSRHLVWREDLNRFGWRSYLGDRAAGPDGYAAPARAIDLQGLPPACISVGALDLFLREDLAYAGRLAAAGVPVEMHVYPGAVHAFELVDGAQVTVRYRADRLAAVRRAVHGRTVF